MLEKWLKVLCVVSWQLQNMKEHCETLWQCAQNNKKKSNYSTYILYLTWKKKTKKNCSWIVHDNCHNRITCCTRFIYETSQNYRPVCVWEHPCICMSHINVNLINILSLRAFSWKLTFPPCLWEKIGCLINCLSVSQSLNTSDRMCTKALKKKRKPSTSGPAASHMWSGCSCHDDST